MKKFLASILSSFALAFLFLAGTTYIEGSEPVHASCTGDPSTLSIQVLQGISANQSDYQTVSNQTQVPWQLLAAIHYRETNFSRSNPSNGQGIFQFVNGDGGPYPTGPVSAAEFRRQLKFMADRLQDDYVFRSDLNYPKRHLRAVNEENFRIKDVLFSYNGRASVYAQQAAQFGYNSNTQPYEGSPYVMNRFDCQRSGMGIITMDFGDLDGIDTRYGAFTIYSELTNGGFEGGKIVSGDDWDPGRVISNHSFYEYGFTGISDLQKFLNKQVGVCDTNGDLPSEFSNGTRAEYATDNGNPPPFRCLKAYREDPSTHENNIDGNPDAATADSAARIFWEAGAQNGINPQVLLALVQSESKLINDDWPWESQYREAAGIECPSGMSQAQCDDDYYGLYNQVHKAAEMLADFADQSQSHPIEAYQSYNIDYHPTSSCNTPTPPSVYISNEATAALYNLNPYQPNQSAQDNLFGNGNSCSSDENLNFWAWFNYWFGTTNVVSPNVRISSNISLTPTEPYANQNVTASFGLTNTNDYDVAFDTIKVAGRGPNNVKGSFPNATVVVPANGSATYSETGKMTVSGEHNYWITHATDKEWVTATPLANNGVSKTHSTNVKPNPVISLSLSLSDPTPAAGDDVTAMFRIRNYSLDDAHVGDVKVAVRDAQGRKFNFATNPNITVNGGTTYTYSETRSFPRAVRYEAWVLTFKDGKWHTNLPETDTGITSSLSFKAEQNPLVTTSLAITPDPHVDENVTATFTVTNDANNAITLGDLKVAGRDEKGGKFNFPTDAGFTVPANSTATYSESRTLPARGTYNFWITNFAEGAWNDNYPASDGSAKKTLSVYVNGGTTITTSLGLSNPTPDQGGNTTASFTVTNHTSSAVPLGDFKIAVRDANGGKFNFPTDAGTSVPAGGTYTYSETRSFPNLGDHTAWIVRWNGRFWDTIFPLNESNSIDRNINFTVVP